jgi:hypothetical protein
MLIGEILFKEINTEKADYIIKFVNGSVVYAHKIVLMHYSKVFERAIQSSKSYYEILLDLKDIPEDTFIAFLEYCYLGKLRNAPKIKKLAALLENSYLYNEITNQETKLRLTACIV